MESAENFNSNVYEKNKTTDRENNEIINFANNDAISIYKYVSLWQDKSNNTNLTSMDKKYKDYISYIKSLVKKDIKEKYSDIDNVDYIPSNSEWGKKIKKYHIINSENKRFKIIYVRADFNPGWVVWNDWKRTYHRTPDETGIDPSRAKYYDPITKKPLWKAVFDTENPGWDYKLPQPNQMLEQKVFTFGVVDTLPDENDNMKVQYIQMIYNEGFGQEEKDYYYFSYPINRDFLALITRDFNVNSKKTKPSILDFSINYHDLKRSNFKLHADYYIGSGIDVNNSYSDESNDNLLMDVKYYLDNSAIISKTTNHLVINGREGGGMMRRWAAYMLRYIDYHLNSDDWKKSHQKKIVHDYELGSKSKPSKQDIIKPNEPNIIKPNKIFKKIINSVIASGLKLKLLIDGVEVKVIATPEIYNSLNSTDENILMRAQDYDINKPKEYKYALSLVILVKKRGSKYTLYLINTSTKDIEFKDAISAWQ